MQIEKWTQNRQVKLPIFVVVTACALFHHFMVALENEKPDSLSFIVWLSAYDISLSSKSSADGLICPAGFRLRTVDDTNEIPASLSSFPGCNYDEEMTTTDWLVETKNHSSLQPHSIPYHHCWSFLVLLDSSWSPFRVHIKTRNIVIIHHVQIKDHSLILHLISEENIFAIASETVRGSHRYYGACELCDRQRSSEWEDLVYAGKSYVRQMDIVLTPWSVSSIDSVWFRNSKKPNVHVITKAAVYSNAWRVMIHDTRHLLSIMQMLNLFIFLLDMDMFDFHRFPEFALVSMKRMDVIVTSSVKVAMDMAET